MDSKSADTEGEVIFPPDSHHKKSPLRFRRSLIVGSCALSLLSSSWLPARADESTPPEAEIRIDAGVSDALQASVRPALQSWATHWSGILREHEQATGEGIRVFFEIGPAPENGANSLLAREYWLKWDSSGDPSRPSHRCVGVATWKDLKQVTDELPAWSWFCGLSVDTALAEIGRHSPFAAKASRLRSRVLENVSPSDDAALASVPAKLLETTDLLSAHLLSLLAQLHSPVELEATPRPGADRMALWQNLAHLGTDPANEELIGGDEDPVTDLPIPRWVLLEASLTGAPVLLLLGAWIASREERWTRFGRRRVSAAEWLGTWVAVLRTRGAARKNPTEDTEVLRGSW